MLHDALASHHVRTVILGDYLSGAAGELSALQFPEIWLVENDDYCLGRRLIDQYLEDPAHHSPPWRCTHCGETVDAGFNLCWNCSGARE